jgi:hypothetical protein
VQRFEPGGTLEFRRAGVQPEARERLHMDVRQVLEVTELIPKPVKRAQAAQDATF